MPSHPEDPRAWTPVRVSRRTPSAAHGVSGLTARRFVDLARTKSMICQRLDS